jgi:hypothetical protein
MTWAILRFALALLLVAATAAFAIWARFAFGDLLK